MSETPKAMVVPLLIALLALAVAYAAFRTLAFIRRLDADLDTPLPLAFEDPNSIKPVRRERRTGAGQERRRVVAASVLTSSLPSPQTKQPPQ